mgnify:CR=1 FL=1
MNRQVYLSNQAVSIDPQNNVGAGGQAIVVKHGNVALKLWHSPDPDSVAKVQYLLSHHLNLPPTVLVPLDLVRLSPKGKVIGYSMPLLPADFRELAVLFNYKLRLKQNLDLPLALKLLHQASSQLEDIHHQNLVIGDLSGRNIAFVQKSLTTYWYDIDSWVINNLPCPVWTEFFVDPKLVAATHHGQTPDFSFETDRYSFSVILFWSLFLSHPYQGNHQKLTTLEERASKGIWLFDSSVTARPQTPHPETVSDDLLGYFESVFAKSTRPTLPTLSLEELSLHLVLCPACDSYYSATRKSCPSCQHRSPLPEFNLIKLTQLLKASGNLIFTRYQKAKLFAIAYEQDRFYLYIKSAADPVVKLALPPLDPQTRFELLGDSHLITSEAVTGQINIWQIGNPCQLLTTTTSTVFNLNHQLAYRASGEFFYRLAGRQLLASQIRFEQLLERPLPIITSPEQTWFWSDPNSDLLFGLFQVFARQQFWLITRGSRYEVEIPALDQNEQLLDLVVKFSSQSVFLRRLTQKRGRRYLKTYVVDFTGQVIFASSKMASSYPTADIHGCAYDHLTVFLPTDQGLVKEDLKPGGFTLIPKTSRAVTSFDSLVHLGSQKYFLVIRDQSVDYLILP